MTTPVRLTWWGDLGHRLVLPSLLAIGLVAAALLQSGAL
mgnify:CR=1 FL=1|jgi:hypothetical protein